ncbi:MAG: dTMP kinase [Candidatus Omnitrophica bacterium]|nr:dTMP kinase [Candidatus Omnitrophota bacterium]MBU1367671.1 dTMP kinase [Candidatus Omnitrophota bacterium]MBU1523057.1 dTMP kinase [Candidatus Omnitrophota bacterium]MBU2436986.1 dTMP kinase [Candidatus Omnitrophota bacterium]MBU2504568.1 dTMP kinase [Candidatus Omnitrophota bacterium]
MSKRAVFITIEGLEGSGKSSVIEFLENLLQRKKFSVKVFREPGSTRIGEKIRKILLDKKNKEITSHTELLLYLAARTQLIEEKLNAALSTYDFVICDRFFDSTLVYQGYAGGLGELVEAAVKLFSLGIKPDLTIVLDSCVEEGLKRIKNKDRIEKKPLDFHKKVRDGYLRLWKIYPARIRIVDARTNLEDIYKKVEEILKRERYQAKK